MPCSSLSTCIDETHGRRTRFSGVHTKFMSYIICIFWLAYEDTFICLLNLTSKEEGKYSSCSFKLLLHQISKFFAMILISITKDNIINIDVNDEQVFSFRLIWSVVLTLPMLRVLSTRNFLNLFYQTLGDVSNPIMSYLIHIHSLKTGGCSTYIFDIIYSFTKTLFTSFWKSLKFIWLVKPRNILMASRQAKGAKVSSKSIPSSLLYHWATKSSFIVLKIMSLNLIFSINPYSFYERVISPDFITFNWFNSSCIACYHYSSFSASLKLCCSICE